MADQAPRYEVLPPTKPLTTQSLLTVMREQGSARAATLIADLHAVGGLPADQIRPMMGQLYNGCPNPMRALPRETWLRLFEHAGYTDDGEPATRPSAPFRLWRGAPADYRDSWSWTDDRELAQRFATLRARRWAHSAVWTAVVEPWRLLAFMMGGYAIGDWMGPGREYVVNTAGLTITADGEA